MKTALAVALLAASAFVSSGQTLMVLDLTNNVWRYEASGADLGTAWRGTNYDDAAWPSGPGLFGFEDNPAVANEIRTTLPLSGTNGAPIITYYFRTHFQYDGSVLNPYLMISNIVDDGAVFYVNGVELGRVLMPAGPIRYTNLAAAMAQEAAYAILEKRATNLLMGDNLLAAEVHQQATTSGDIVFGAALFIEPESATTNAGTINYFFDAAPNNFIRSAVLLTNGQFLIAGGFTTLNSSSRIGGLAKIDQLGNVAGNFAGGTNVSTNTATTFDVYALHVTAGQIYIGGTFNGQQRTNIARLNWDGSLDTAFVPAAPNGRVRAIVPQPDGRIIIAGEFNAVDGVSRGRIARLHANGSLDATFATNTGANNRIRAVSLLSDGKILIGGAFSTFNGAAQNCLARLDTNGTLDATFASGGGGADGEVYCFTKFGREHFVGGNFTNLNGTLAPRIALIDSNGNHDFSFNVGGGFDGGPVYTITEQFNGRLIVGGGFTSFAGQSAYARLTRLNPNGSHDGSFTVSVPSGDTLTTVLAPDGQILVAGLFAYQFNQRTARILTLLRGDGPPVLSIERSGNGVALSWPDLASTFALQEASGVGTPWTNSSASVTTQERRFFATNTTTSAVRFFRLNFP